MRTGTPAAPAWPAQGVGGCTVRVHRKEEGVAKRQRGRTVACCGSVCMGVCVMWQGRATSCQQRCRPAGEDLPRRRALQDLHEPRAGGHGDAHDDGLAHACGGAAGRFDAAPTCRLRAVPNTGCSLCGGELQ